MSRVSYFQRFSQPENHATNNTLLVLRHFYRSSPFKIQKVLTSLLDCEIPIGLAFEQQIRGEASVPDALISQDALRIFVETKRDGVVDCDQIRRHFRSIAHAESSAARNILIALTKELVVQTDRELLAAEAASQQITFVAVTFSQIVEALKDECSDFEQELRAIVDDYEAYLEEEGLMEDRNQWLLAVPCGMTLDENVAFSLYYEPEERTSKQNYRFIGLYRNKAIQYVGSIKATAVRPSATGEVACTVESGQVTDDHRKRISEAVKTSTNYNHSKAHRFYLVDSFVKTNARKISRGGMRGRRDLSNLIPDSTPAEEYTTAELATALDGISWE